MADKEGRGTESRGCRDEGVKVDVWRHEKRIRNYCIRGTAKVVEVSKEIQVRRSQWFA